MGDKTLCPSCRDHDLADDGACTCGFQMPRRFDVTLTAGVEVDPSMKSSSRHGQRGEVAPHIEVTNRTLWNHDRQRRERRQIVADGDRDYYLQEWTDPVTGEVYRKEGQLSDPNLHGESARRPRPSK